MVDYFEILATKLKNGELAAFLGAGISKTYKDPRTGKTYQGLLDASSIVERLVEKKSYLTKDLSFGQAFFLLKNQEGRTELERNILDFIDKPGISPLPAHELLANMPFSVFLTTNFDSLTEKSLTKSKKSYASILDDNDVPRWRGTQLPVIKLHGCITRPDTLIAAEDEYIPIGLKNPVVEALVKTLLSKKTALFLGFALKDIDFKIIYDELMHNLKEHMPKSYAIVHSATDYEIAYWKARGIEIIISDLTEFLRGLLRHTLKQQKPSIYHANDDWMNNDYFHALVDIRTSPSETQTIDAFLTHLQQEVASSTLLCEDILDSASMAVNTIIASKPNFQAFRKLWDDLRPILEKEGEKSKDAIDSALNKYVAERKTVADRIGAKWNSVVKKGDNILVFSQSIRIINILKSATRGIQESCKLYICECRPKSPEPFQDAYALCESLRDTEYQITIIPDVCLGNLISRKQINKVIMGAHALYFMNKQPVSFVNTCGSLMIAITTKEYEVPLFIVAESAKYISITENDSPHVSYMEEENIFINEEQTAIFKTDRLQGVSNLNVGYDLCPYFENMTIVSED
jgi:translation initiation factor 2B subunit (eIF-2B alpha/beta/delta family)